MNDVLVNHITEYITKQAKKSGLPMLLLCIMSLNAFAQEESPDMTLDLSEPTTKQSVVATDQVTESYPLVNAEQREPKVYMSPSSSEKKIAQPKMLSNSEVIKSDKVDLSKFTLKVVDRVKILRIRMANGKDVDVEIPMYIYVPNDGSAAVPVNTITGTDLVKLVSVYNRLITATAGTQGNTEKLYSALQEFNDLISKLQTKSVAAQK